MIRPDPFYRCRAIRPRPTHLLRLVRGGAAVLVACIAIVWFMMPGCETTPARTAAARPRAHATVLRAAQFNIEPTVRVRLAAGLSTVRLSTPAGRLWIAPPGAQVGREFDAPVTVHRAGRDFVIQPAQGGAMRWTLAALHVRAVGRSVVHVNDAAYPGAIVVHGFDDAATFDVVNHLPMEQYLPGVLSRELYASWHLETHRAQAIAARSYALAAVARWRSRWYDLESTTASQAYGGANANARAVQAVADTRGIALTWRGDVLTTYYSSSTGGTGQDAAAAFADQADLPPLRGREHGAWSSASPHYRWGPIVRDRTMLARRITAWGAANRDAVAQLRGLRDVAVTARNTAGRPTRFRVTDDAGRAYDLGPESFRFACNFAAPGLPALPTGQQLKSSHVEVTVRGAQVVFHNGRGHGHGVGLDQYGAQAMAQQGHLAPQILAFYYPGAQAQRLY